MTKLKILFWVFNIYNSKTENVKRFPNSAFPLLPVIFHEYSLSTADKVHGHLFVNSWTKKDPYFTNILYNIRSNQRLSNYWSYSLYNFILTRRTNRRGTHRFLKILCAFSYPVPTFHIGKITDLRVINIVLLQFLLFGPTVSINILY